MSRYKFALNSKIKGYVEWQIEHYQEDKKQLEQYKADMMPPITQQFSLTAGTSSGRTSDPTGTTAMRFATSAYIQSVERNIHAIEKVLSKCESADLRLIDLIYWKQTYTIEGAGLKTGFSRRAAYYRINDILCAIALEMGLVSF